MTTISLPWPPKACSPNSRASWRVKARVVKKYREACAWEAAGQASPLLKAAAQSARHIEVRLRFHPPNKHRRDLDNCIGACKALLDGLADALGVDDHKFRLSAEMRDAHPPYGHVEVEVVPCKTA